MSEISVRVLQEDDWQAYRQVRLAALQESPEAFLATTLKKRPGRSSTGETVWCRPIGCLRSVRESR